jgi:predicted nucleic acid-binding protein
VNLWGKGTSYIAPVKRGNEKISSFVKQLEIIAPTLITFEASSVIRNKVFRGILSEREGGEIISLLKQLDISLIYTDELLDIAWEIGAMLNTLSLYDCFYLALRKLLRIPLWTADKRLFRSAKKEFPFLNLL